MTEVRLRFSLAVTTFLSLTAIIPPTPASAQLYSHGSRSGSNAAANHADSIPTSVASSGGAASSDSNVLAPAAKVETSLTVRVPANAKVYLAGRLLLLTALRIRGGIRAA